MTTGEYRCTSSLRKYRIGRQRNVHDMQCDWFGFCGRGIVNGGGLSRKREYGFWGMEKARVVGS